LKPENLLIAADGYLKLADFGFARRLPPGDRADTLCGTPEYLAPELVQQAGHTKAVDWWALGVLIFEMVAGRPPFSGDDRMAMFRDIVACRYAWPAGPSKAARDLVRQLLRVAPAARLGAGRGGAGEVRAHPWFAGFDWDGLTARTLPAPFVPPAGEWGSGGDPPPTDDDDEAARERYVSTGAFADF
jgi:cGMP-dependent protein kinase